jgi:hypothetical protein
MTTQEQKPHVHGPDCQHDHHEPQLAPYYA